MSSFVGSYPAIIHACIILQHPSSLSLASEFPGGFQNGEWMPLVSGTPAKVASQGIPGVRFRWILVFIQQGFGGAYKSRRTVSALKSVVVDICLNDGVFGFCYAFSRFYAGAVAFTSQRQTRENRSSIHNNGTGAAGAQPAAPVLGRCVPSFVTQDLAQAPVRFDRKSMPPPIDGKINGA
jgi:hypothetical protein